MRLINAILALSFILRIIFTALILSVATAVALVLLGVVK